MCSACAFLLNKALKFLHFCSLAFTHMTLTLVPPVLSVHLPIHAFMTLTLISRVQTVSTHPELLGHLLTMSPDGGAAAVAMAGMLCVCFARFNLSVSIFHGDELTFHFAQLLFYIPCLLDSCSQLPSYRYLPPFLQTRWHPGSPPLRLHHPKGRSTQGHHLR